MATLVKTKRRINSVTSTRKITNAMNLVAAVKLKRFKNTMSNGDNYVSYIRLVMEELYSQIDKFSLSKNTSNKTLFIVINSNLGLCGSFNNDVFKYVEPLIKKDDELITIGLKGFTHFKNLNYNINSSYMDLNVKVNFDDINKFSEFVMNEFKLNKYKEIKLVYTEYVNSISFVPILITLLPLEVETKKENLLPPETLPDPITLYEELTPVYLSASIYQAIVTSQVSEQASRRNAMENATDNADDILEKLKLEYNKARQGAITQEITEVVSGAKNLE